MIAGDNVRLEERQGVQRLISAIAGGAGVQRVELRDQEGAVKAREYTVSVQPVAQISGDVGADTGNIDFQGNVEIQGSVTAGFRVSATSDVTIAGGVEAGARVEAGGNLTVQLGIMGKDTIVNAGGDLMAKFIQEAQALSRLQHPNTLRIYDFGYLPGAGGQLGAPFQVS